MGDTLLKIILQFFAFVFFVGSIFCASALESLLYCLIIFIPLVLIGIFFEKLSDIKNKHFHLIVLIPIISTSVMFMFYGNISTIIPTLFYVCYTLLIGFNYQNETIIKIQNTLCGPFKKKNSGNPSFESQKEKEVTIPEEGKITFLKKIDISMHKKEYVRQVSPLIISVLELNKTLQYDYSLRLDYTYEFFLQQQKTIYELQS